MANVTLVASRDRLRVRSSLRVVLAVALLAGALGLFMRWHGYADRLLWTDEAITAMRTAGYTQQQFVAAAVDSRPHDAATIRRFAGIGNAAPLGGVVRSLAIEDAQHPPLYYVLTALWTRAFGQSIAMLRAPAVAFGMLVPFAVAWMCFELYGTRAAAALGFALSSVSPILVIYSQQAREYGLWVLLMALATALVLRAARTHGRRWWFAYAACAIAGMYTNPLFATVLVSHAIYAAVRLRGAELRAFIVCAALAAVTFVPWAVQILLHKRAIDLSNAWTAGPWPLTMLVEKWAFNAGTTFFDLEYDRTAFAIVLLPIAVLAGAALWWNLVRLRPASRTMIGSLLGVPFVALLLPDLIMHSHRSSVTRYGMALWLALVVAVAGFLASRVRLQRTGGFWIAATVCLVLAMTLSSAVAAHNTVWWDNREDGPNRAIANVLNEQPNNVVVVVPGRWQRLLALSFYLQPNVYVDMLPAHAAARKPAGFENAYLLGRPPEAQAARFVVPVSRASTSLNAQVARFRGGADSDALTLWRFVK